MVSVYRQTTGLTAIVTLSECQGRLDLPTVTALLAGREPAVGFDQGRSVPGTFVGYLWQVTLFLQTHPA